MDARTRHGVFPRPISLNHATYPVAVVLPTYCEAENIEHLIQEIQELKIDPLIVVIDDSSPDKTPEMVKRLQEKYGNILLLLRPTKLGLGTAITDGFRFILSLPNRPEYIITMDADYSHNPQDIPKLIHNAQKGNDLVIGSRYCPGGGIVGWHFARLLISRCANLIASTILDVRLHDCTSGFRCYSLKLVEAGINSFHGGNTYRTQIETISFASSSKFRIKEVPITFANRKVGKSKLTRNEIVSFFSYVLQENLLDFLTPRQLNKLGIKNWALSKLKSLEEVVDRIVTGARITNFCRRIFDIFSQWR